MGCGGVARRGVVCRGEVWCGVELRGAVQCSVMWRGAMQIDKRGGRRQPGGRNFDVSWRAWIGARLISLVRTAPRRPGGSDRLFKRPARGRPQAKPCTGHHSGEVLRLRLCSSRSDSASLSEGSHCRLAATGAATRAQLHAYPGGGSLRGLPPSVNPSGNNIHTHTHTHIVIIHI